MIFLKIYFQIFTNVSLCLCECMQCGVCVCAGVSTCTHNHAHGDQKKVLDSLELELHKVVSCLIWVLRPKAFSGRAGSSLYL